MYITYIVILAKPDQAGHIMISYQHAHQKIMIKVKETLKKQYKTWMDVDDMGKIFIHNMLFKLAMFYMGKFIDDLIFPKF